MREIDCISTIHAAGDACSRRLPLPDGVSLHRLISHEDGRGNFTEIFRDSWGVGGAPVQWNMVRSNANVLRGVHVHRKHADYLLVVEGEMILILHDIRASSAMRGTTFMLRLQSTDPHLAAVPVGVAHAFYFPTAACHVYAMTGEFDSTEELGCHWQDAHLGIQSLCNAPKLSARDAGAGSYAQMVDAFLPGTTM